ncbi:hypothetical protein NF867_16380 [Solitalea sp. MAHUQ-68]|uniref:Uncharacterized protein n=1 Tax=Solitalea agri TaxID=2953739 RepID=A0A9X2F5D5_9SPHI|nr:hypothetical protein [Solitalea agri]MCO4294440.1 hypothetical protein [Solitalea agri]
MKETIFTKNKALILTVIGIYQITGAAFGMYNLILSFSNDPASTNNQKIVFALPLFLMGLIAGITLLFNRQEFIKLTYINQILQIIQIKFSGFGFFYVAGGYIAIGYLNEGIGRFTHDLSLFMGASVVRLNIEDYFMVLFNVIPLLVIFLIRKATYQQKTVFENIEH